MLNFALQNFLNFFSGGFQNISVRDEMQRILLFARKIKILQNISIISLKIKKLHENLTVIVRNAVLIKLEETSN